MEPIQRAIKLLEEISHMDIMGDENGHWIDLMARSKAKQARLILEQYLNS